MFRILFFTIVFILTTAAAQAENVQYDIRVDGMTCPFCVATSEKALKKIEGVELISTDLEAGVIHVCTDDSVIFTEEQLKELFLEKGFTYRSMTKRDECTIDE